MRMNPTEYLVNAVKMLQEDSHAFCYERSIPKVIARQQKNKLGCYIRGYTLT